MSSMWNFNVISWAPKAWLGPTPALPAAAHTASHLGVDRLHSGSAALLGRCPTSWHLRYSRVSIATELSPVHVTVSAWPLCRDSTPTTQRLASVSLHDSLDLAASSSKLIPFEQHLRHYQIPVPACDVARPPCTTAASVSLCFRRHLPGHLHWRSQEPLQHKRFFFKSVWILIRWSHLQE